MTMLTPLICSLALLVPNSSIQRDPEPGSLQILDKSGKAAAFCPLQGTKVEADIAGFGARVVVRQTFLNPTKEAIEAVYTFPLPADAAVDRMKMRIGDRVVQGEIKRREDARRIYDAAKSAGQAAALLDQERPNIFTQSVANITPGAKVDIEISYVQLLKFEEDKFEFSYPMVVGPRFTRVTPDPGKVTPPITPKGTRTGATIDLTVRLDAGAPITSLESDLHQVEANREAGSSKATITLAKKDEIPNRDFILRYGVASNSVQSALLTYADAKNGGFFTLILMPPKAPTPEQIAPREVILVMDQSGSQSGFPIGKSKELCKKMIEALRPEDTFNVMGFSNALNPLWPEPRPNTAENRAIAQRFVSGLEANGGTMLNLAINAAMKPKADPKRVRLILFNTDGFVGDEFNILDSIQKFRQSARIFTFGIGNGVNRFLIDSMSVEGKGDSEIVTLQSNTDEAVQKFLRRTQSPVLTNIEAEFQGVAVADVLPSAIPDVFSEKPVILKGRYTKAGAGKVTITGLLGGYPWRKDIMLRFPDAPSYASLTEDLRHEGVGLDADADIAGAMAGAQQPSNLQAAYGERGSAIATLWAREMIEEVQRSNWLAMYSNLPPEKRSAQEKRTVEAIENLGLRFGLMTQYTSFVAVEKRVVNVGGKQRTVAVPVEMTDGVSYEGIFGDRYESLGRGGGGFGGGAYARRAMPATAAPVLGKPVYADAEVKEVAANLGGLYWDEAGGKLMKSGSDGKRMPIPFAKLTDEQIQALPRALSPEQLAKFLKGLKPEEMERYALLTRVDPKLRKGTSEPLSLQIWTMDWAPGHLEALKKAGLEDAQGDGNLKTAFGTCAKASLAKIAALPFVRKVVPLEG
jgi:Ca-activated chloride channel family protein